MPDAESHLDPLAVGRAALAWDEHHLELRALAARTAPAPPGFTPAVAQDARDAALAAELLTDRVGSTCEVLADGLRVVLADWLRADRDAGVALAALLGYLVELR